jgi:AcrR family transcriptional regulator
LTRIQGVTQGQAAGSGMGIEERRKREKEARKLNIVRAARKLFYEKGFKDVTVAHFARKAELSKGAVYLYFTSKEEIYAQILLSDLEKIHNLALSSLHDGESAAKMLTDFAEIYVDTFLKDRESFRKVMTFMLQTDHLNLSENLNQSLIKLTNKTIDIVGTILKCGVEKREFPPNLDIWQSRNIIWGMLNGIISLYIFTGKESSRERVIKSMIRAGLDHFIDGIKTSTIPINTLCGQS